VASTTMKMLRMRIWSEIVKYHQQLEGKQGANVGELIDSKTLVRWQAGNDRNGIFGMAVEEGPVDEVVNNLIGIKAQRVLLILDEMQGVREAIMKATFNLCSNPQFSFIGMGNPDSLMNPLGRESEPLDGWESVVRAETEQWETHGGPTLGHGVCGFYDGRKSPADDSPEERKRMPWLCNKDTVARILKGVRGNENAPEYWQMAIGWPPPMGLEATILDQSIIDMFKCRKPPVWVSDVTDCAALDPSFNGGDKAILQFGKRGKTQYGWAVGFGEWMEVPINADSSRPIHYQIVDFVKTECQKRNIPSREFACLAAGEGGGLVAIFNQEWGPIVAIEEGGSPSELTVDEYGKTAREAYDNRSSELCFGLRNMAMANGLGGISEEVAKQACARRTFYRNGKWCVEPKTGSKGRTDERGRPIKGFKQRMGYSPDHFDAGVALIEHCRLKGAVPSATGPGVQQQNDNWHRLVKQSNAMYSERNYANANA
jgi:hypothetical protein